MKRRKCLQLLLLIALSWSMTAVALAWAKRTCTNNVVIAPHDEVVLENMAGCTLNRYYSVNYKTCEWDFGCSGSCSNNTNIAVAQTMFFANQTTTTTLCSDFASVVNPTLIITEIDHLKCN